MSLGEQLVAFLVMALGVVVLMLSFSGWLYLDYRWARWRASKAKS